MLLSEIAEKVGMTKRAVKYYEEKKLLAVKKDANGYRNYTDEDVKRLKSISPLYYEYKEALDRVNNRICQELGMYYDSDYHLVLKE